MYLQIDDEIICFHCQCKLVLIYQRNLGPLKKYSAFLHFTQLKSEDFCFHYF